MKHASLQSIVQELLALDASLREREADVARVVELLLEHEPNLEVDPAFMRNLREKLLSQEWSPKQSSFISNLQTLFSMKQKFVLMTGVSMLLVTVGVATWLSQGVSRPVLPELAVGSLDKGSKGFGTLTYTGAGMPDGRGAASGFGGSGLGVSQSVRPEGDTSKMIAPQLSYTFQFTGTAETLPASLPVYRRVVDPGAAKSVGSYLSAMNVSAINLRALNNAGVRTFELVEDGGYSTFVDLREGRISMNPSYDVWQKFCPNGNCAPIQTSDLPSDEDAIRLSDAFLAKYGIQRNGYGSPVVDSSWRLWYERAADKSMVYLPDVINVTYPLLFDGKATYSLDGRAYGLTTNLMVRGKEVQSVWNIMLGQYEKSEYEVETSMERIMQALNHVKPYFYMEGTTGPVTIELTNPEFVYTIHTEWDGNSTKELFVPAYRFEVKSGTAQPYQQTHVVVPVAKDIVDAMLAQPAPGTIDGPIIMLDKRS